MPMKHDVVYVYKKENSGEELRYSMRSLKNITNFSGRVYVVGDKEDWFSDEVTHIPARRRQGRVLDGANKWKIACETEDISSSFIAMHDDIYITEKTRVKPLNAGSALTVDRNKYHNKLVLNTGKWLKEKGINNPLSYSLHAPMIMNKKKRLEVHEMIKDTLEMKLPLLARTVYGNLYIKKSEEVRDNKTKTKNLPDATFISTQEFTPELQKLFPRKSKYEKSKAKEHEVAANITVSVANE